ncbi:G protein-coupled receptor 34 like [Osmerus mordax]|uniref:G protein-coupled receptor 34 like n=1 Tax=Osmerus mordax TaxID=8014 RepID=UPI00350FD819
MAILVFFLRKQSVSSMAVYLRHLGIADFLLVLCLPMRVHYHNTEGPFLLCKMVGVFFYLNMYASILFLSLISLDRYLKILKPLWVRRMQTEAWSRRASRGVWAGLVLVMSLFFLSNSSERPCDRICFHFHHKGLVGGVVNLTAVALFVGAFLFFVCFYGQIAVKLRAMSLGCQDARARRKKSRVILKTLVVPFIFTLCFLPYHVVRVPYVLAQMGVIGEVRSKQTLHMLNELTLLLSALNSCLDPVLYYLLSSTYRRATLCALQGKFKNLYALSSNSNSVIHSVNET